MNWLYEGKDLIGSRVISITDTTTKDKVSLGEIVRWEESKNGQKMPVVKFEDGTENVCYSLLMPYSDEFYNMLKACDPNKVWSLCADISLTLQVLHRQGKTKKLEE